MERSSLATDVTHGHGVSLQAFTRALQTVAEGDLKQRAQLQGALDGAVAAAAGR